MKKYKWIGNEISYVITVGIVGFLFAILLLRGKSCSTKSVLYHEVNIPNKDSVVLEIFHSRLERLADTLNKITPDSPYAKKSIFELRTKITSQLIDSAYLSSGSADTSDCFYTKIVLLNPGMLRDSIASDHWQDGSVKPISFIYYDTSTLINKAPKIVNINLGLAISQPSTLMEFIYDNPLTGFWLIFSVAQMMLWFLVLPLLLGKLRSVNSKVKNAPGSLFSIRNWLLSSIIPLLFVGLFTYFFYVELVDTTIIKDHYFLNGFNSKMICYGLVGYLVTAGCFGMYLHMSMALDQLDRNAQTNRLKLATDLPLRNSYEAIKETFDGSFLATTLILSSFVLWTGITFTTINQTEAMRFYKIYSGKDFLSYDFVYLVGAFHTILLLLFYVPVRVKFSSLEIAGQAQAVQTVSGNKILKNLHDSIVALLVTTSPILTSLLQKLLSGIFST
jgi:hypothetical protein